MNASNGILALVGDPALRDDVDRVAVAAGLPVVHAPDPSSRRVWGRPAVHTLWPSCSTWSRPTLRAPSAAASAAGSFCLSVPHLRPTTSRPLSRWAPSMSSTLPVRDREL